MNGPRSGDDMQQTAALLQELELHRATIKRLRALLMECRPSVSSHTRKRRKGVDRLHAKGGTHEHAELRLCYLSNLMDRIDNELRDKETDHAKS
jgi:hypothetical protein